MSFDPNHLLTVEKEKISHGLRFRYSETKSHLKDVSLPVMELPVTQGIDEIGTDDALLKWRYTMLLSLYISYALLVLFPSFSVDSMALDYEEYSKGWLQMATSLPSEASYGLVYQTTQPKR